MFREVQVRVPDGSHFSRAAACLGEEAKMSVIEGRSPHDVPRFDARESVWVEEALHFLGREEVVPPVRSGCADRLEVLRRVDVDITLSLGPSKDVLQHRLRLAPGAGADACGFETPHLQAQQSATDVADWARTKAVSKVGLVECALVLQRCSREQLV